MVLHESHFGSYAFSELFAFNWFQPYWLGHGLIWSLAPLLGYILAAKLVIALAVVGYIWSLLLLRREVNAPPSLDWLFLAVPFGFAYEWGFLNFIVTAPLAPLFLVSYLRFLEGRLSAWWILLWVVVLFFGHLLILAFFCVTASLLALRTPCSLATLSRRIAPLTLSIPLGIAWMVSRIEPRNIVTPIDWSWGVHRLMKLLPDVFSMDYNLLSVLLAAILILLPFIAGARPKRTLSNLLPLGFYLLFMLFAPSTVYSNFGTYERFQMFGILFLILLLADARVETPESVTRMMPVIRMLPILVGLSIAGRMGLKSYGFEQETAPFQRILAQMQPGKRALSLVQSGTSEFTRAPVYLHYPVWYQTAKKGLVDFNFAYYQSMNAHYKPEVAGNVYGRLAFFPEEFNWAAQQADKFDYFVVRGTPEFANVFFQDEPRVRLKHRADSWFLFEMVNDPGPNR